MNIHIIKNGVVQNTIAIESIELARELFPDFDCAEHAEAGPGWTYADGVLTAPVPPAPVRDIKAEISALEATITPRRVREAVLGDNEWLANVDAQIAALRLEIQ